MVCSFLTPTVRVSLKKYFILQKDEIKFDLSELHSILKGLEIAVSRIALENVAEYHYTTITVSNESLRFHFSQSSPAGIFETNGESKRL